MKKAILVPFVFFIAVPAHAISIVSLHTGATCPSAFSTSTVGTMALITGIAALAAIVLFRIYKRRSKHSLPEV